MTANKALYDTMAIDAKKMPQINKITDGINKNKARYEAVTASTGVPWNVIAAIHYRESGNSFKRHLHNGDPLTARTVQVPKGRPVSGEPPFTWEESAIDAIKMQKLNKVTDWSIGNTLELLERYNGLGYRKKGVPSPYIWSWSSQYQKGKYVADGKYDPNTIDQQCGVAVLLKFLT
jgi:lysozyme family protein